MKLVELHEARYYKGRLTSDQAARMYEDIMDDLEARPHEWGIKMKYPRLYEHDRALMVVFVEVSTEDSFYHLKEFLKVKNLPYSEIEHEGQDEYKITYKADA